MMTNEQKYEYWLDIAEYDIVTAEAMLNGGLNNRYPEYISKLSSQVKEPEASSILVKTKEVFAWLLTLKP